MSDARRSHVVIIGGGFGGVAAARALADAPVDVTLVDRTNHHLFQPLLYQVATAGLSPGDIAVPIRWLLRRQRNVTVLLAEATAIDPAARTVTLDQPPHRLAYDACIVATGIVTDYFGQAEWAEHAPGLKTLADAAAVRERVLLAFERAEATDDPAERAACLTFVVVGGGPTGVELAGAIVEIAARALRADFRRIDTARARVVLLEAGDRLLPAFHPELSAAAATALRGLGVEVRLGARVTDVTADAVQIGTEVLPTRSVCWAAGTAAAPLVATLEAPRDRAGRIRVAPDLSVPGYPTCFVVGDVAAVRYADGEVPGIAPAANQEGAHAAQSALAVLAGRPTTPFRYRHKGDLATIGRHQAVAAMGALRLSGLLAWLAWLFIHLLYLVGFRNRVSVFLQWGWAYLTFQRGVRLIFRPSLAPRGGR